MKPINALPLRSPETETGGGVDVETEITKTRLAKHEMLDATGKVVEDEEEATGIRYTRLDDGKVFEKQIATMPDTARLMLAIFGARTLATNEASQVKQKGGGDYVAAIHDRFDLIESGKWVDKSGGGKIDLDTLAQAIVNIGASSGKTFDLAVIRAKLDDDAPWRAKVRQVKAITDEYATLKGRTVATVEDVFGAIG